MNNKSNYVVERFWSKVDVSEKIRCWNWKGAKSSNGYGSFGLEGKTQKAHRVAYWLRNGEWPINACHTCDNPICVNPDHLFNGTKKENALDMVAKGRHPRVKGSNHGRSVLTEEKVLLMREEYKKGGISLTALGEKYGCTFTTSRNAINRKTWTHI